MSKLRVNRHHFSKLFWNVVLQNSEAFLHHGWAELRDDLNQLESLRSQADYNTGSISPSAAFALYALCAYFRPASVVEVGTFIGKSALSIARAMEDTPDAVIHTCDYSNAIELNLPTGVKIVQYKKMSSTQMFSSIKDTGAQVDLLALDGRISREDLLLLQSISHAKTIVALDDFEGVEKGVANAMLLTASAQFKNHLLIYPADGTLMQRLGFMAGCTTAVLLPASLVAHTAQ